MKQLNGIKEKSGFTLAETLIVILLLGIILGVVPSGIKASISAYKRVEQKADAMSLLSTIAISMEGDMATGSYRGMKGDHVLLSSGARDYDLYYINGEDAPNTSSNPDNSTKYEGMICFVGPENTVIPIANEATHTKALKSVLKDFSYNKSGEDEEQKYEYYEFTIQIFSRETGELLEEQTYKVRPYR